jgi:hypothetical protein
MLIFSENLLKRDNKEIYLTTFNYVIINMFTHPAISDLLLMAIIGIPFAFNTAEKDFNTQKNENFNYNIRSDRPSDLRCHCDGAESDR